MNYITGKIKNIIYQNEENGYTVALLRVKESNIDKLANTTVQIVGSFYDLKYDVLMELFGEYSLNSKYNRYQFNVSKYNLLLPTTNDKIIEFLTSSLINGCGKTTAERLVELYKENTLEDIKNLDNIMKVKGMTESKALKIHKSILNYDKSSAIIIKLEELGFTVDEASKILNKYKDKTEKIIENDFYQLKELIEFDKLDRLYLNNNDAYSFNRLYHCMIESMNKISNSEGHTYYDNEIIKKYLSHFYNLNIGEEEYENVILVLQEDDVVNIIDNKIYLKDYIEAEVYIAASLKRMSETEVKNIPKFDEKVKLLEERLNINYDNIQENAIKTALINNVTIISGGPGTGKTTILNGIVRMYINENKLSPVEIIENIALLAPTGRASKRMCESTGLYATTIHRYLKWHKESDSFEYDEFNKTTHKFVVIDEASMIDVKLFSSLLKALKHDTKILLVGDSFQLPSVGAGLVLNNLIESDLFNYISLTNIYRQSDNSFIPYLAKSIKSQELDEEFLSKKDDYNFINCSNNEMEIYIKKVLINAKNKGLTPENMQVLVPTYKGINGIDRLNVVIRDIYNEASERKNEILVNDILYREGDKILQLVNDPDNNIFNGDIGYIKKIIKSPKIRVEIDFEGNIVEYERKKLNQIKQAYAISIHKSQGSEFDHVIMPISKDYFMMMYNKLLYTGVSRAKKSLILLGDPQIFATGVRNNRADNRNTSLKDNLISIILNN